MADMTDAERDERSGDEWLHSVLSYLNFRAGCDWRELHRAGQRSNPVRWYYLDAIRLINSIGHADASKCHCAECNPAPKKRPARHLPTLEQIAKVKAVS